MRRVLMGLLLGAAVGCGGDDALDEEGCRAFCQELGCPAESAACDSVSTCTCFGCDAFYEMYYQEMDDYGPACSF